ncbi:SpoIIIAH-like family protein [Paenibacillus sp. GCM10023252]|uniref:SpoIIIAH-like family protein n=1 Tax=Paenibacillus sp. GCM10023252 TaxID=3252649 RepID=UPI00362233B5
MNTKRQTIWLVSMLSLMVILSAYYLFTEDVNAPDVLTDGTQTEQSVKDATEAAADKGEGGQIVVDRVETGTEADKAADAKPDKQEAAGDKTTAKSDEEVLKQYEESGILTTNVFDELQYKRDQANSELQDKLMASIADTGKTLDEESNPVVKQLEQLEEKTTKITSIEEELIKQFGTAVVQELDNESFKVVVESEKLEPKQAAVIIDLVMETLDVDAGQVSVQYIAPQS